MYGARQFEYMTMILRNDIDPMRKLDEKGMGGWELVSVVPNGGYMVFYFKREL